MQEFAGNVYRVTSKAICTWLDHSIVISLFFKKFYSTRWCLAKLPKHLHIWRLSGRSYDLFSPLSVILRHVLLVCRIVKSTDESKRSEMWKRRGLLKIKKSFKITGAKKKMKIRTKNQILETLNKLNLLIQDAPYKWLHGYNIITKNVILFFFFSFFRKRLDFRLCRKLLFGTVSESLLLYYPPSLLSSIFSALEKRSFLPSRSRINQRWASDAERNRVEFDHQHKKKEMRPMRVMKCDMFSRKRDGGSLIVAMAEFVYIYIYIHPTSKHVERIHVYVYTILRGFSPLRV